MNKSFSGLCVEIAECTTWTLFEGNKPYTDSKQLQNSVFTEWSLSFRWSIYVNDPKVENVVLIESALTFSLVGLKFVILRSYGRIFTFQTFSAFENTRVWFSYRKWKEVAMTPGRPISFPSFVLKIHILNIHSRTTMERSSFTKYQANP